MSRTCAVGFHGTVIFTADMLCICSDILKHIVYDFQDSQMLEMLRPSLEEAFVIQSQEAALDYIGKRGECDEAKTDWRERWGVCWCGSTWTQFM